MSTWIRHALACTGLVLSAAAGAAPIAEVVALKGEAVVVADGKTQALAVGSALDEGQVVRSMNPGRVKLRFVDGSVMVIGDGSTLRIERFKPAAGGKPRQAGFVLDVGLISQTVAPSGAGSWTVRTSSVVTAVRGTQYLVEVRPDQSTDVSVQTGAVVVETAQEASERRRARLRGAGSQEMAIDMRPPAPVTLDRANAGTNCNAEGECSGSRPWTPERLRAASERLAL
ncbi:FecR family protein [Piscinibacter sakaiensis]|uniref:FecR protein domain-containing protein n=1 Tax=Piscinibacter sakaiensis TaxID=1547922 RepID=A0A0K8NTW8_PISS1|nr:FecR domain-containing protein [Piscinibacter sakaiensis]GAP33808.1 hypothetical protein ISF6_1063 [Piscinibacter sakaiensis]